MDRGFTSPNFDAARPRSNSLSHVPYYYFSASAPCHRRDAEHISSRLPPLHPISTAYEAPRFSASGHAVPSPTTACSRPHPNGDTEARFARLEAAIALLTLGHESRRQHAPRDAVQSPNHGVAADAVSITIPIPTQTSLLMPEATVDSAVADAPGQRLAQQPPPAAPATTNPPPSSARPQWDSDDRDLLLKSAIRPQFTEAGGVRIRAFLESAENFLDMCGRPRDRWARFIFSWLGANEAEKVRRSHLFSDDEEYTAFKTGLITLFGRLEFEDSYRQQLRDLTQAGSESIALYASARRT